ncbi:MAG: hypothetical protein AAGA23_23685, partial [Pseudomonadota bacterium]
MKRLNLLLLLLPVAAPAQDLFEPDDTAPIEGPRLEAGRPDAVGPASPTMDGGEELSWQISGRQFAGPQDLDWFAFNHEDYPICMLRSRIRIAGADATALSRLRVELREYEEEIAINPATPFTTLQSCGEAPVGIAEVTQQYEFKSSYFYRLRSCTSDQGLNYDVEFRMTEDIFCTLSRNVTGTVSDARSGRAVAAYVFTNENTLTFTDAQGDFDLV